MFANLESTDRGVLHKLLALTTDEVTLDEREVWARAIDGAVRDATRSSVPARNRVARPGVVLAAAPALSTVATVLRDEDVSVSREAIDAVRKFMTDGIVSPLYGRDTLAARRGADALRSLFSAETAKHGHAVAQRSNTI
jgi:hypothetical protein